MRPRLLHPLRQRPHERPSRRGHGQPPGPADRLERPAPETGEIRAARLVEPHAADGLALDCDPAVMKVRQAGGPIDQAVYTCGCGYLFSADVSTTVVCPHCGCGQAW
jgi:hypothetical protein